MMILMRGSGSSRPKPSNGRVLPEVERARRDPLAPARGVLIGVLIGVIFWIVAGMVIWLVWFA